MNLPFARGAHNGNGNGHAPLTRTETDSQGTVEVPAQALWGAQTARSLTYFAIGTQTMPLPLVHAMAWIKWAAAVVNCELLLLDPA